MASVGPAPDEKESGKKSPDIKIKAKDVKKGMKAAEKGMEAADGVLDGDAPDLDCGDSLFSTLCCLCKAGVKAKAKQEKKDKKKKKKEKKEDDVTNQVKEEGKDLAQSAGEGLADLATDE